jgi:hypothetical protein
LFFQLFFFAKYREAEASIVTLSAPMILSQWKPIHTGTSFKFSFQLLTHEVPTPRLISDLLRLKHQLFQYLPYMSCVLFSAAFENAKVSLGDVDKAELGQVFSEYFDFPC